MSTASSGHPDNTATASPDESPAERRRIDDIADLLDAEETLYEQAIAAMGRGDRDTAVPLLRRCAEAGTGEAAWLLGQLLEDSGDAEEAMTWYQRARDDGDPRAEGKCAGSPLKPARLAAGTPEGRSWEPGTPFKPLMFVGYQDTRERPSEELTRATFLADLLHAVLAADLVGEHPPAAASSGSWLADNLTLLCAAHRDWTAAPVPLHISPHHGWLIRGRESELSGLLSLCQIDAEQQTGSGRLVLASVTSKTLETWAWARARTLRAMGREQGHGAQLLPMRMNLDRAFLADQCAAAARPARRPVVVADLMLPPSEVPECGPYTSAAEALERLVQSGVQALPVCEMSRVIGIVTLSDLARNVSDRLGEPSGETVRALMRPAVAVPPDTPVTEIAEAIAGDGIIVVSRPDGRPAGYVTAESVLTQALPGASSPTAGDHPGLLVPGTGSILLARNR